MRYPDQLEAYSALLQIRQSAFRRNAAITGVIFLIAVLGTFAFGLLGSLNGKALYLVGAIVLLFGIGFLQAWVKHEIVSSLIDFVGNLQRMTTQVK